MRDLICDVIRYCAGSCTRVNDNINILTKTHKWGFKTSYTNFRLKWSGAYMYLRASLVRQTDERGRECGHQLHFIAHIATSPVKHTN